MRDITIKVRMTEAERDRLVALAAARETTVSEVVRQIVREAAVRRPVRDRSEVVRGPATVAP